MIKSKILVFHAEDDMFVPIQHSRYLVEVANKKRPKDWPEVKFVEFKKELELGHGKIYTHQEIYPIIK